MCRTTSVPGGTAASSSCSRARLDTVHVAGLALDYCVKATALDAKRAGFDVIVHREAVAAVEVSPGDGDRAVRELSDAGIDVVDD